MNEKKMPVDNTAVIWPAVVKCRDDDELTYVDSLQQWSTDPDCAMKQFQVNDILIDSQGAVYTLVQVDSTGLQEKVDRLSLDQVLELVKQHASVCGQCCVSKMGAPSIAAAIQMVRYIE